MFLCSFISLDKSDLHSIISVDGLGGSPLTEGVFAYLRASSKATWGVKMVIDEFWSVLEALKTKLESYQQILTGY